jgi:hypothetical protein
MNVRGGFCSINNKSAVWLWIYLEYLYPSILPQSYTGIIDLAAQHRLGYGMSNQHMLFRHSFQPRRADGQEHSYHGYKGYLQNVSPPPPP